MGILFDEYLKGPIELWGYGTSKFHFFSKQRF